MRVLLRVLPIALTVVLAGYWLGDPAARAQGDAPSAGASQHGNAGVSQYGSDLAVAVEPGPVEPVTVDAAPAAGTPASAASSTSASASGSSSATSSASASSSASPASEDQYEGEYPEDPAPCDGEECEGETPPSEKAPRAPEDYPGFYWHNKAQDLYYYDIECWGDCGVENAVHPSFYECHKQIIRRFSDSGEVVKERSYIYCEHPRWSEWASSAADPPKRWANEVCIYQYDESGRIVARRPCSGGSGGSGLDESANDAQEVDDELEHANPHRPTHYDNEEGPEAEPGPLFGNLAAAEFSGEAGGEQDIEAGESGNAQEPMVSSPVGPTVSGDGGKRTVDPSTNDASPTTQEERDTVSTDEAQMTSNTEEDGEGANGFPATIQPGSVLAERLLTLSSAGLNGQPGKAALFSSGSVGPGTVEGDREGAALREVREVAWGISKAPGHRGQVGEDVSGDSGLKAAGSGIVERMRAPGADDPAQGKASLIVLAGGLLLGTMVVLRRRF